MVVGEVRFIGKESNKLEEAEEQTLSDASDVYTEYPNPLRDDWTARILPRLRKMPLRDLIRRTGMSRRAIYMIRAGRKPSKINELKLRAVVA